VVQSRKYLLNLLANINHPCWLFANDATLFHYQNMGIEDAYTYTVPNKPENKEIQSSQNLKG
jgi:hypothetical protein